MDQGPFLESSHTVKPEPRKNPFLPADIENRSLSEMAVLFGTGSVLVGLASLFAAFALTSIIPAPLVFYLAGGIWVAFSLWLWISLVLIGKISRESRVSDRDLIALQILFFLNVFSRALFASSQDRVVWHEVGLALEWCVIGFHILYFLLALCVWVRLPWRSYIGFVVMLALAIFDANV